MKEFKGTPGEWHVMRGDVLDKNGRMVASIEGFCPGENEIYDALLISAAPDLLEALQDMLSGWKYIREQHGDLYGVGWDRAQDKAQAAISKALGDE